MDDDSEDDEADALAVGLIDPTEAANLTASFQDDPALATRETQGLGKLRAVLDAVLRPLCTHRQPAISAIEDLNQRLGACPSPSVDQADLTWVRRPIEHLADIQPLLVQDAADIVTTSDHQRLRHCPSCQWLFIDTSRNRGRRWCDMADCGSRDKARRYYHRQQS